MTFDRLGYIDRSKLAGVDEASARAHAEDLRDALLESVAIKLGISELEAATKAEFRAFSVAFDRKLEAPQRKLDAKIDN